MIWNVFLIKNLRSYNMWDYFHKKANRQKCNGKSNTASKTYSEPTYYDEDAEICFRESYF